MSRSAGRDGSVQGVSDSVTVVWDDEFLSYDLGPEHPLNPVRLALTVSLARQLGVLDRPNVTMLAPRPAGEDLLTLVHDPAYLDVVRAAPTHPWGVGHGFESTDNPVFPHMYEASALIAGGSVLAAEQVWSGASQHAVNIAGGLHHAMRSRASGFCVFNDPAIAIARLLDARRRAGRVRRRRRAPRRRRPGRLLRRPAGAHGQPPPEPADAVPGHRLPGRGRPRRRGRHQRQRRAAGRHRRTRAGTARSTRSCRACCGRSGRRCWSPSPAATPTTRTRWPSSR